LTPINTHMKKTRSIPSQSYQFLSILLLVFMIILIRNLGVFAGSLSAASLTPTSSLAGRTTLYTINFTTVGSIPANGKIKVTFPTNYDISGAVSATCSSMNGGFSTGKSGQVVTFTRNNTGSGTTAGNAETCTVDGIKNPTFSATTGTFTIQTTDSSDSEIDSNSTVAGVTTTPNNLNSTNVQPAQLTAGSTTTNTISFQTSNSLAATDKIKITFGANFDVSGANNGSCSGMDGSFNTTVSGQIVTLTRSGGSTQSNGAKTCTVDGIKNPPATGSTGTYSIQTTDSSDNIRDQNTSITPDTISANSLTNTNVQLSSLLAGAAVTTTITFTNFNSIANTDVLGIGFPSGFDVTGANGGSCTGISGITTSVSGQNVALTRNASGSSIASGAQSCTVSGIKNPTSVTTTGSFSLNLMTSGMASTRDNGSVSGKTITANTLSNTDVQPQGLGQGVLGSVNVAFTTTNTLASNDKIKITFSSGFDLTGMTGASCSTIDGTITASVSGQTVTLARNGTGGNTAAGAQNCLINGIRTPGVPGSTGTYQIQTTTVADVVRDQDTAVSEDYIPPGGGGNSGSGAGSGGPLSKNLSSGAADLPFVQQSLPESERPLNTELKVPASGSFGKNFELFNSASRAGIKIEKDTIFKTKTGELFTESIFPPFLVAKSQLPKTLPENLNYKIAVDVTTSQEVFVSKPITLTIPLISAKPGDPIKIYFYNKEKDEYMLLEDGGTIGNDGKSISVKTSHLTIFVAAEIKVVQTTAPAPAHGSSKSPTISNLAGTPEPVSAPASTAPSLEPAPRPTPAPASAPITPAPIEPTTPASPLNRAPSAAPNQTPIYIDIADHWAKDYILKLSAQKIMDGTGPTTFEPDKFLTRGEMVKIAMLAFSQATKDGDTPSFKDVNADSPYAKYLAAAEKLKIIHGYSDGTFKTDSPISRAETLKILFNAAQKVIDQKEDQTPFYDIQDGDWFTPYVNFGWQNGIVSGKSTYSFAPNNFVTRAEIAKMVVKTMELQ